MTHNYAAQRASYRQGLVLGLTMAEIMLLMVFTLLLVAGALLQKSHARIASLEQRRAQVERDANAQIATRLREIQNLEDQLARTGKPNIPDNWRELVAAARASEKALSSLGYRLNDVRDIPDTILKSMPRAGEAPQPAQAAKSGHDWPPIIRLSEADHYYFQLGKAEISPEFRDQLIATIIPRLLELIGEYDVNVIEVIGHTDEVPVTSLASNLDAKLIDALRGNAYPDELTFSDNAGLAMARASAVARVLIEDERLALYRVLPMSGAQVITTDERLAQGNSRHETAERRRIEIRLRRTSQVQ
jgi:flagellar motor protein MotB